MNQLEYEVMKDITDNKLPGFPSVYAKGKF